MKVHFDENNSRPSGTASFASWENPDLLGAIRQAFRESPKESITDLWIDQRGITAVFETRAT